MNLTAELPGFSFSKTTVWDSILIPPGQDTAAGTEIRLFQHPLGLEAYPGRKKGLKDCSFLIADRMDNTVGSAFTVERIRIVADTLDVSDVTLYWALNQVAIRIGPAVVGEFAWDLYVPPGSTYALRVRFDEALPAKAWEQRARVVLDLHHERKDVA